jgi:hypothetical protein
MDGDVRQLHPSMHGPPARFRPPADIPAAAAKAVADLRADLTDDLTPVQEQWRRIRFWCGRALVLTLIAMAAIPVILAYLGVVGPFARWAARRWGLDW